MSRGNLRSPPTHDLWEDTAAVPATTSALPPANRTHLHRIASTSDEESVGPYEESSGVRFARLPPASARVNPPPPPVPGDLIRQASLASISSLAASQMALARSQRVLQISVAPVQAGKPFADKSPTSIAHSASGRGGSRTMACCCGSTTPCLPVSNVQPLWMRALHKTHMIAAGMGNSTLGCLVSIIVLFTIVVSVVLMVVQTLPDYRLRRIQGISGTPEIVMQIIEYVVVVIFTVEYGVRLLTISFVPPRDVSQDKWMPTFTSSLPSITRFVVSPMGLIDLASIVPFYVQLDVQDSCK
jgi:hypothetical protein